MIVMFFIAVFCTATGGAIFKPDEWYRDLAKPNWTPPDWVFPLVWSTLYVMIAIAGWLVWREAGLGLALFIWIFQLIINFLWSYFFFGMRRMDFAFIDVSTLWLMVAAFILAAWPVSIWASLLFVPYLVWVTIAAVLNLTVWRMNPSAVTQ